MTLLHEPGLTDILLNPSLDLSPHHAMHTGQSANSVNGLHTDLFSRKYVYIYLRVTRI